MDCVAVVLYVFSLAFVRRWWEREFKSSWLGCERLTIRECGYRRIGWGWRQCGVKGKGQEKKMVRLRMKSNSF